MSVVVSGCLWLSVVVSGCLWLSVVVCGCLWLSVVGLWVICGWGRLPLGLFRLLLGRAGRAGPKSVAVVTAAEAPAAAAARVPVATRLGTAS